jgi:hypothetical protein
LKDPNITKRALYERAMEEEGRPITVERRHVDD